MKWFRRIEKQVLILNTTKFIYYLFKGLYTNRRDLVNMKSSIKLHDPCSIFKEAFGQNLY